MSPTCAWLVNRCAGGFFHAVALAFDFDQVGVMEKAVENGRGRGDIANEFAPFFQGAVGGHQGRAQFVAAHDDLEEVFAGCGWELFDAHVVDDQQIGKQIEDRAVQHDFATLDQFVADGLGEVAFTHTGRADQQDVFGSLNKLPGSQIVDLPAVDGWVEAEVEGVQCAPVAEICRFGAPGYHALLAYAQFVLQEQFEELQVIEVIAAGFLQAYFQAGSQSAQAQLAQGVIQVCVYHGSIGFVVSLNRSLVCARES